MKNIGYAHEIKRKEEEKLLGSLDSLQLKTSWAEQSHTRDFL